MKKEDVPQDLSALGKITKEVCYATDPSGKYVKELSKGWEVKITALDVAWKDINNRMEIAKEKIRNRTVSPLFFFMEQALMDIPILAGYTGFWKFQIERHMKPEVFDTLTDATLQKYADVFNVTIDDIKKMNTHEA